MVAKKKTYTLSSKAVAAIGGLGLCCVVAGAAFAVEGHRSDLVNRKVLRVCADPANLPFSNEKKEGFENKIAEIIGNELSVPVEYTWFPQATGFTRNTLLAKRCDVIIGTGQGDELVLNTNALYRSAYALIYKPGTGLDGVESIFDPKLKGKKVGTVQGTPSANLVAKAGLMIQDAQQNQSLLYQNVRALHNTRYSSNHFHSILYIYHSKFYTKQNIPKLST